MEPLLPAGSAAELAELSAEVFRKSGELTEKTDHDFGLHSASLI
jgi:hypothetical protein